MSLYTQFKSNLKLKLKEKLSKSNIHQVPEIKKIVICMGIGSLSTRKGVKDFSDLESNLIKIAGQKPIMLKSKKAISNFKLREGLPVMLKVTLRRDRAYDFIERLTKMVFPRVRDFAGIYEKNFDGKGNYNIGFPTQVVFPELRPEDIVTTHGIQITIATSADTNADAIELFKELGFIFAAKK